MTAFEWTAELQAETPPFRGDGVPLTAKQPIDGVKLLAPIATALAPERAPEYAPRESLIALAATGKGTFVDEADALVILGGTGQKGPNKGQLTIIGEADATRVVNLAVDRWVQLHGLEGAFEIFALLGAWKPYPLMTVGGTMVRAMRRLRVWLAHSPEYRNVLARAVQVAETPGHWPHWKPNTATTYNLAAEVLAYVFPDHREFFATAAAQLEHCDWTSSHLVGSIATVADYHAIAARVGNGDLEANALVIPRSLREAGLEILIARTNAHTHNLTIARALTAYHSAEAAGALAAYVANKGAQKLLAEYFAAHRELAEAALTPFTSSNKRPVRDAAAKLFASPSS